MTVSTGLPKKTTISAQKERIGVNSSVGSDTAGSKALLSGVVHFDGVWGKPGFKPLVFSNVENIFCSHEGRTAWDGYYRKPTRH